VANLVQLFRQQKKLQARRLQTAELKTEYCKNLTAVDDGGGGVGGATTTTIALACVWGLGLAKWPNGQLSCQCGSAS